MARQGVNRGANACNDLCVLFSFTNSGTSRSVGTTAVHVQEVSTSSNSSTRRTVTTF